MKRIYIALAVAGLLLPMSQLVLFARDHGADPAAFLGQLFANAVSSMFAFDLVISSVVFWIFVYRSRVPHRWLYVALTLVVGLSFALPLFLALSGSEQFGATLPLTSDERERAATTPRPARAVR
ncbi:MAG TPA: DUF2834 domain-containing protein [Thermoanaerobaculia bacterium]|jgi:hypothetical protein|nr:DUF2834 domain-containing protein [Thermoanaerobaculia bacterium]